MWACLWVGLQFILHYNLHINTCSGIVFSYSSCCDWYVMTWYAGRSVSLKSPHIDIWRQFQVTRWCVILSIDVCSSMASTFPPQCYIEPTNSINRKHYTWLCTWEGRGINRPPYLLAGIQREGEGGRKTERFDYTLSEDWSEEEGAYCVQRH